MKISKMIEEAKKLMDEKGDMDVFLHDLDENASYKISSISYEEGIKEGRRSPKRCTDTSR